MRITIIDREGNLIDCSPETVAAELQKLGVDPFAYDVNPETGELTVGVDGRHLPVAPGETDKEKCIRLFGKENPSWNDLAAAGYTFASGRKIEKSP
jgi:hypothetical protein